MKKISFTTESTKMLSDTITPVSIYLKIRDVFPNSVLLESSDYRGNENSFSYICLKPLATIEADKGFLTEKYPDGTIISTEITGRDLFNLRLSEFIASFEQADKDNDIPVNGLFGYTTYDAVRYFDKIDLNAPEVREYKIPDFYYTFYKYIIAVNHFQNTLHIIENKINGYPGEVEKIKSLINSRNIAVYSFKPSDDEISDMSDGEYKKIVAKGREHCHRGDVFQVVMSRRFSRKFTGDEFNVYRALRSVNPSPYLFYFDFGSFKIFGSSPEAHLKISKSKAYINPIAGTFRRTGDDENDKMLAQQLASDLKENAEHVMLVDLARNDLSRHTDNVRVENFREVQFYSHVIHLVSSVSGVLKENTTIPEMMTSTFPAGTLTGAPKYKAMQLIDKYESGKRGYYGGAIGLLDFRGNFNHAIMIRTFLSRNNILFYQAGAGIVAISDEEKELQEVNNKLGALRKAIEMAKTIN